MVLEIGQNEDGNVGDKEFSGNILVIEDDEGLNRIICKNIERLGFRTQCATNGSDAIAAIRSNNHNLILLDYKLPDMNANKLINIIREKTTPPPFIIITGQGDQKLAVDMMKQGAMDYLVKDGSFIDTLHSTVRRTIKTIEAEKKARESELALLDSENRYRALFDNNSDGIIIADIQSKHFLFANQKACEMFGYTVEEILTLGVEGIHPKEDMHYVLSQFEMTVRKEKALAESIPCLRKDGTIFFADINSTPLEMDGSLCTMSMFRDITERRQSEDQIRSLAKFPAENPNPVLRLNRDGIVIYANPKSDYLLKVWNTSVGGHIPDFLKKMVDQSIETGEVAATETLVVDRVYTFIATYIAGENYINLYGNDITNQKRAEENLRFLSSITTQISDGIIVTDKEFKITYVNKAQLDMCGYEEDELIGKSPDFLNAKPMAESIQQEISKTISKGDVWTGSLRSRKKNGDHFWIDSKIAPLHDKKGVLSSFFAVHRDITEQKQAKEALQKSEEQLQQSQKMEAVGRLAGGVAHDFNNMLSVIIGNAQLAMMAVDTTEPVYKDLQEIIKAGERSADLTRQLLAFARKQTVSPIVIDLNKSVPDMLKMLQRLIGEDIDLAWLPGHNAWTVKIDPSQVDQILANLMVNARDAIAGVGKVTIETENTVIDEAYCAEHAETTPGEYVMLVVSDNGCGIEKDVLEHIFEPFFTTKETGKGTGLGLATVYGAVKQNNGFINVYSEPGEGTMFKVYLPRFAEEGGEAAVKTDPQILLTGTETVLIVEDEPAILDLGRRFLLGLGYTVLTAETPTEAIRQAEKYKGVIHLLLTDVVMPEMTGREVAEKLGAARPTLKFLYMSGYTADVIAHHGVLDACVRFVQKPFSLNDLARKVREALDG